MSISQAVTQATQPAPCQCATSALEVKEQGERGALTVLLVLNLLLMVVEATLGWKAESTALLADAADNLADAAVYAVAVYAIGRSHEMKCVLPVLVASARQGWLLLLSATLFDALCPTMSPTRGSLLAWGLVPWPSTSAAWS